MRIVSTNTRSLALGVTMIVIGLWPERAHAGSITLETQFTGANVGYFYSGFVSGTFDGFAHATLGSVLMDNGAGLGAGLDAPASFEAYCVDIFGSVFDPGTSTQAVPVTVDATPASMSAWSDPGGATTQANAGAIAAYLYNTFAPTVTLDNQNDERTALAMAIWNVLYDTDFSVSNGSGAFYVWDDTTGTIVTLANAYLAAAAGHLADATWLQLSTATQDVQDFMGPAAGTTSVPEPSSALLLLAGLFGVAAARQRSRRSLQS